MKSMSRVSVVPTFSLFIVVGVLLLPTLSFLHGEGATSKKKLVSEFSSREMAQDVDELMLMTDAQRVVGWLTTKKSLVGETVKITVDHEVTTIDVEAGNTFAWSYDMERPTAVKFEVAGHTAQRTLKPADVGKPSAFFVIDRNVYRPGHTMNFAAFLRSEDKDGTFVPLVDQKVEAKIVSKRKKTTAGKVVMRSDAFGRVTGSYTFSKADALDTYQVELDGYLGSATVELAEFRKAKVQLKIDGERQGTNLKLKFQALDFLNKPVTGSKVTFAAKIFKSNGSVTEHALNSDDFVYHETSAAKLLSFEGASEEEKLLAEAGELMMPSAMVRNVMTANLDGRVAITKDGSGEATLPLEKEWTKGNYSVFIEGVLLDYNGREQRSSKLVNIGSKVTDCNLHLQLDKHLFATDEPIRVGIQALGDDGEPISAVASVMAMRLSPSQMVVQPWQNGYYGGYGYRGGYGYPFHLNQWNGLQGSQQLNSWNVAAMAGQSQTSRSLKTAAVVKDNVATLTLDKAGAYKLVCIAELPDGRKLQNEVGCVVRDAQAMPTVILKLDDANIKDTDQLSGEVHCRLNDARVLLTVSDSHGVRLHKTLTIKEGASHFSVDVPKEIGYGCVVEVHCLESKEQIHVDHELVRIEPTRRMLDVAVKADEVYGPGEEVSLDIDVNRNERVDLVVSVFDKSLLGVAKDESVSIRDFYLADERARMNSARDMLGRRLGNVTVKEIVERLQKEMQDAGSRNNAVGGQLISPSYRDAAIRRAVQNYTSSNYVYAQDLATLLSAQGVAVAPIHVQWSWYVRFDPEREKTSPMTVMEALENQVNSWTLQWYMMEDRFVMLEHHPSHTLNLQSSRGMMMNGFGGYGMAGGNGFFSANASFSARGDAFNSRGMGFSSGQSFISHMPVGGMMEQEVRMDGFESSEIRRDFSDSAFWNANVRTKKNGKAKVTFKLPDSLTNWHVVVTAISKKMHVGHATSSFRTFKPIMIWPMIPRTFTEGDRVTLYGSVHNRTEKEQEIEVSLAVNNGEVVARPTQVVRVPAKGNVPVYWDYEPETTGYTQLLMTAKSDAGNDASLKRLPVAMMASEQFVAASGFARDAATIVIPSGADLSNSEMKITLVPSLLDDVVQSLDYLVDYPYGCVEQTMSKFLPAIVVKQTLDRAGIANPALEEKLPKVVEMGVKRLLELQRDDNGWGWHGGSQTHEMMTPYALYGLLRAEKAGYEIPNERAIELGLGRLRQFINSMGESQTSDRIYCMYVYSMRKNLEKVHWDFIEKQQKEGKLSDYALAMTLEMALANDRKDLARRCVSALHDTVKQSEEHAFWTTANFSRWGNDRFEITAAVLKALVAHDPNDELVAPTLAFFTSTKRGNRWNSTKDTAMIIYAICDYAATQDYAPGKRNIVVEVNGTATYDIELEQGLSPQITVPIKFMREGENKIKFAGHAPGAMFRAVFTYWERGNIQASQRGLDVTRTFHLLDDAGNVLREIKNGDTVPKGAYIQSVVTAKHKLQQQMRYVLVENHKPASCEILPAEDQRFAARQSSTQYALREDKTAGVFYHHEQTGHTIKDACVLHAELAGTYQVPPARVELMYETLTRGHSAGFTFIVK